MAKRPSVRNNLVQRTPVECPNEGFLRETTARGLASIGSTKTIIFYGPYIKILTTNIPQRSNDRVLSTASESWDSNSNWDKSLEEAEFKF